MELQWTNACEGRLAEAPEAHAAWGNLAHVHEMRDDFAKASKAVSEALRITPDYPPYLF